MIKRNTLVFPQQFATGQYAVVRVGFVSDKPLAGRVLKFNPGFYTDQGVPSGNAFQVQYPLIPATTEMQKLNCKNHRAFLINESTYKFSIEFRFFVTRDLGGWIPDIPFINSTALNTTYFQGNLGFHVQVLQDRTTANIPIEIFPACEFPLTFSFDNFVPGKDLPVTMEVNTIPGNNVYIGLIQDGVINQAVDIIPGLIQSYSEVGNGSTTIHGLPNLLKSNSHGFIFQGGKATAKAVIDGANLKAHSVYRIYVVYYQDGAWRSCISERIRQKSSRAPITPVITTSIEDSAGYTIDTHCGKGLSNLLTYNLSVTVDETDYNAKLAAEGYAGGFTDYLVEAKAFIGKSANANSGISIPLTDLNPTFTVENFSSSKPLDFVIIQLKINIDGIIDYINIPFDLTFDAIQSDYDMIVYDADGPVDEMCDGDDYIVSNNFACDIYQSIDNAGWVENTILDGLDINLANVPVNSKVCFKALCSDEPFTGTPSDCECPPCPTTHPFSLRLRSCERNGSGHVIFQLILSNLNGTVTSGSWTWFELDDPDSPTIPPTPKSPPNSGLLSNFSGPNISETISTPLVGSGISNCQYIGIQITLNIQDANGNSYEFTDSFNSMIGYCGGCDVTYSESATLDTCFDCECPDPVVCNNYAAFEITCDEVAHEVSINLYTDFESTVTEDDFLCSLDGGNTFIPCPATITGESNIFVKYDATFDDECEPLHIEQVIHCIKKVDLPNDRQIELEIDGGGGLLINITDDFGSTVVEDILYVSLDGGETYQSFDLLDAGYSTINLTGGESIVVYTNTVFEEGYEDLQAQGQIDAPVSVGSCNDYLGYELDVTFDEEEGEFTVTKTGDEVNLEYNILLWTLNGGDPFSGAGIPYLGVQKGEGMFIAAWRIKLPDCGEKTIYAAAYGKPCIKICELPPVTLINPPLTYINNCCDECPDLNLTVTCVDRTLTITGFIGGATIEWTGPGGFTATGNPVTFPEGTPSGTFTATITDGACVDVVNYPYTQPNAGTPIDDPILI